MARPAEHEVVTVAGREVTISNPRKVLFPQAGYTKLDLVRYYLAVADGALRGARRPAERARPLSQRHRRRVLLSEARARVAAAVDRGRSSLQLSVRPHRGRGRAARRRRRWRGWRTSPASSCIRIRFAPTISITPTSCASISIPCRASRGRRCARSRASCAPRWTTSGSSAGRRRRARAACTSTCASSGGGRSTEVRRAALAFAREVERRAPALATSKWWKEERHGVFLDYNQNAKDRTVAGAYSVRPKPDARVSAPLTWDEIDSCEPEDFTLATMPARFAEHRRSARRHRSTIRVRSSGCSSSRRATSAKGWAMRRGRRTTRSSRASRRACSHRGARMPKDADAGDGSPKPRGSRSVR